MPVVKICGVTIFPDALHAAQAGADMIGLNFYPPSPRSVAVMQAEKIALGLRQGLGDSCPILVGLFVNETPGDILQIVEAVGLDAVQLSGDESPEDVVALEGIAFKSIRPRTLDEALALVDAYLPHAPQDERLPSLLLDAYHPDLYGGTGEEASVEVAEAVKGRVPRLMLAGGLKPENVGARVATIRPWGVDVASGVEGKTKGRKDAAKIQTFIEQVRDHG